MAKLPDTSERDNRQTSQSQVARTLHELAPQGARQMLQQALAAEVQEHVERHQELRDCDDHQVVVRNGYGAPRTLMFGTGPVEVQAPRVDDGGLANEQRYRSQILPRYARRTPERTSVLPTRYLHGLSSGDFRESLSALLGPDAAGMSATTITRMTQTWTQEYETFRKQRVDALDIVYLWVDGVHLNIRLEEDRLALLVVIGVTIDGTKRLLALEDGHRESKESWLAVLRDLRERGLRAPVLAVGDGALGFWAAQREVYPKARVSAAGSTSSATSWTSFPSVYGRAPRRTCGE